MKKYIRAYKVKDGILIQEHRSHLVYSESDLKDFCRQNGLKLRPQFYGYAQKEIPIKKKHGSENQKFEIVSDKSKIVSYYAD